MDLVKIGKYIAGKRKALGMTQKQLAEKLNMSDKSVSKWERGICLPDVSVYMELCEILGISINEFLAGEDIDAENVEKKSEDNIIQVTKDSKKKQKNLKSILAVVTTFAVIMVLVLGAVFVHNVMQPNIYITAVDRTIAEMKTSVLLSGVDGAYLFNFYAKEEYKTLTIYLSEYQAGELINKSKVADLDYDGIESAKRGVIAVIPDFELFRVKLIIADDYSKCSTDFPILENVENREYYGRSATQVEGEVPIQRDTEQGLMALIYGEDGLEAIPVKEMEQGNFREKNDYVYYLSFRFGK